MIHRAFSVGFTGTQRGMTGAQRREVAHLLRLLGAKVVHHGDCVGADADFHAIARAAKCAIIGHPPSNRIKRAFCEFDETRQARGYLERNARIVAAADFVIATPGEMEEQLRSGTWSTIRTTRKAGKPLSIVYPTGTTTHE